MQKSKEIFLEALQRIAEDASKYTDKGYNLDGWRAFFEQNHPAEFQKYSQIEEELDRLYTKEGDLSLKRFKSLCGRFEGAHSWALNKYIEFIKQIEQCTALVTVI